ncbi:hypothetical protein ACFL09_05705, partial [Planctomycetota bacterium]
MTITPCRWLSTLLLAAWCATALAAEPAGVEAMLAREERAMTTARAAGAFVRLYNARNDTRHRLPLPQAAAPPTIDGKLDDPCWQKATSVFEAARYVGLGPAGRAMRGRYCADAGNLYLGLDMTLARSKQGHSTIEIHVGKQRAHVEFRDKQLRFRGPAQRDWSKQEPLCRFVGNEADGSFEAAIPMSRIFGSQDWRKGGVTLRFRFGRFAGSPLAQDRAIQLFDSDLALVIEEPKPGESAFRAALVGAADRAVKLDAQVRLTRERDPKKPEQLAATSLELKPGERRPVEIGYRLPFHSGATLVQLALKSEGWESRWSTYGYAPAVEPVLSKIDRLLEARAEHARLPQWRSAAGTLRATFARLKAAGAQPGPREWADLHTSVRRLKREVFLGRLPADLDEVLFIKRHPYTAGGRWFTTHYHFEPGGNSLSAFSIRTGAVRNILEAPAHTALRDPCLHWDGRRIVFAARSKKPEILEGLTDEHHDTWSIYEANADGTGLRRLTKAQVYDLEPVYLPDGRILFGSLRSTCWGCCTGHSAYNFHVMDADGASIRRFTANYLYDVAASVTPDGRIVFLRWVHEDKPGNHINALWTVRQDGSGLAGYFGMSTYGCTIEPRGIPGTREVVCVDSGASGHWRLPQNGNLGIIDPAYSRERFAHHIPSPLPFGQGWGFKTPYPLNRDLFLVSFGSLRYGFGIYLVDRSGEMELLYRDADISCFKPVPLRPTPMPPVTTSTAAKDEAEDPAVVTVLNVYDGLPGIEPGTVKAIRVVQVPDKDIVHNGNSSFADQTIAVSYVYRMVRTVLGTAPVHADGSAHFNVPGDKAVYLQLLDADGLMVQTMRDTTSFKPGERVTCIGCHEPQLTSPPVTTSTAAED